jgi:hypothetical protein
MFFSYFHDQILIKKLNISLNEQILLVLVLWYALIQN